MSCYSTAYTVVQSSARITKFFQAEEHTAPDLKARLPSYIPGVLLTSINSAQ